MKFVPPVVVNGKVYMPNHDGAVAVFGILPAPPSDFSVAVTPTVRAIAPGQTGTFTVTVGAQGGFGESVTLSAAGQPPGATVSFVPTSITGAGISTMSVSLPPDVPEGAFVVTVAGTSGTSVRSAPPVRISTRPVRPIGISFVGSAVPMGTGESAGVISQANWNNAAGAARTSEMGLVDASGGPTTATATWSSSGAWMSPIADQPGNRRLMKGYLDTTNTSMTTITLAGLPQQAYDVYVYVDGDNRTYSRSAAYTISGPGIATATVNLTDASGTNFGTTFTRAADSNGNYVKFTVTASGFTLTATPTLPTGATRRAPVNGIQVIPVAPAVPDFTIAAAPGARTIAVGGSTTYSLAIDPVNGFTGPVMLTLGNVPTGLATSLSASIVNAPAMVTLTVDSTLATPAATSALTITASSGLSKDEIEKMKKDAELHAEEDKQKKEELETRNDADSAVYRSEKMLKDNADKISADDKTKIEAAANEVKEALRGNDNAAIKAASDKMNEAWQAVSAELYKAAAEKAKAGQAGGQPGAQADAGPQPGAEAKSDEGPIIDAEVVDEKK